MIDRIARLGKETALYGLSTVLGRMLNFLLVPLYANYLSPEENGVIATLYSYVAFAMVVYGMGMEQAFMRNWVDAEGPKRGEVFRTAMLGSLPGAVASVLVLLFPVSVSEALGFGPAEAGLLRLAAVILVVDNITVVPFAYLRMEGRALHFVTFKIAGIAGTILLTVLFVVRRDMGSSGVFLANAASSLIVMILLLAAVRTVIHREEGARWFRGEQMSDLLRFGIPLVPAGLAGIALQVVDRPIVRALTDDATVGLYQLNARLAIFMMLAVGMFDFAWRPFFLQHARDADARQLFSRVFTLFSVFLFGIFLLVALFVEDLVRFPFGSTTFFPEFYWQGTPIVPVFLVANMLTGAYVVFLTGVYLEKRTGIVPVISGVAAGVTIAGNLLLVPSIGIMGAALATLAGRIVQSAWMYRAGQRYFAVRYNWRTISLMLLLTAALYAGVMLTGPEPLSASGLLLKTAAIGVFIAGVFMTKVTTYRSVKELLFLRWKSPS